MKNPKTLLINKIAEAITKALGPPDDGEGDSLTWEDIQAFSQIAVEALGIEQVGWHCSQPAGQRLHETHFPFDPDDVVPPTEHLKVGHKPIWRIKAIEGESE